MTTCIMSMSKPLHDGPMYYVNILTDAGYCSVTCVGMECVDSELKETYYDSVMRLPQWMQDKLAVLMVLEAGSPQLESVGYHVQSNTFWVFG